VNIPAVGSSFAMGFHRYTVYFYGSAIWLLQEINTAQKRAFSRAAAANDTNDLSRLDFKGEIFQDV
jgi:hypothetical protein